MSFFPALDHVKVDLSRVFETGHAYVALSRATNLKGLEVRGFNPSKVRSIAVCVFMLIVTDVELFLLQGACGSKGECFFFICEPGLVANGTFALYRSSSGRGN